MRAIFLMLLVVLTMLLSIGCSKKLQPTVETVYRDSIVERVTYIPKEKVIYIDGEQVTIYDTLPCPDYYAADSSKTGKLTATVRIKNGKLTATCKQDSLQKRVEWLEAELIKEKYSLKTRIETKYVNVDVEVPYIPKWLLWVLAISIIINVIVFRKPILSFLQKIFS